MGGKKTKTTNTNTFAYQPNPGSADIDALRSMKAKADPNIPYLYAKLREKADNSYSNPLGSYTSPAVREAATRENGAGLAMDEAQAQQNSQNQAENINYGRQAGIAGMTAPQLVQTGGTQVTKTPKDWTQLIMGMASSAGQGAAMAGM